MKTKTDFIAQLRSSFSGLDKEPLEELVSENLISPFTVTLPEKVLIQAQDVIASIFEMRERKSYTDFYQPLAEQKNIKDPGNKSIAMSYDFHLDENQNLKLIEVNTNASFLALGHEMYASKGITLPVRDFYFEEVRKDILNEMTLQGKKVPEHFKVSIIDEEPTQQRLYVEFLLYNEMFKSWGWDSEIVDYREALKKRTPDFIYNRYTDFFLNSSSSQALHQTFVSREVCFSPNPYEYLLLADKQRLIDWGSEDLLHSQGMTAEEIAQMKIVIPRSHDLKPENAEQLWAEKKKLFFKPKNAFGSKQSYRGSSISHKAFHDLLGEEIIAQEFVPPTEQVFETPEGPQNFKYDLRCYAYQGRLQLIVARLYQGQVTNLRTPYGGFACVVFE